MARRRKHDAASTPARPSALPLHPDSVPSSLRSLPQWVLWSYERRDGEWTKVPHDARHYGRASSTDADTWATFDLCVGRLRQHGDRYDGVGFVFHAAGIAGIDLDDCRDTGTGAIAQWALDLLALLNSYAEVSPSGTGVKVWVRAALPGTGHRRPFGDGEVEVYDAGRFFCVTGHRVEDGPAEVEPRQAELDRLLALVFPPESPASLPPPSSTRSGTRHADLSDDALLERAYASANGNAIRRLMAGDAGDDHSRADQALCNHLAFWLGRDAGRMDRVFRTSGLMRPKWDERRGETTYGAMTVARAIADTPAAYEPGLVPSPSRGRPSRNGRAPAAPPDNKAPNDPHRLARLFDNQDPHLRYWCGEWYRWDEAVYRQLPDGELRAAVVCCVEAEFNRLAEQAVAAWEAGGREGRRPTAFPVNQELVSNVIQALRSLCILPADVQPPAWVGPAPDGRDARNLVVCCNGLLHLPTWAAGHPALCAATPDLWALNGLDFAFDPKAPEPETWLDFLHRLWPDDLQSIETLQDWFGYCLLADTSQHRMLFVVGPTRSGKGTITHVLERLVGERNTCSPVLATLGNPFGLQPLLGKTLAVIADARLSGRADAAVIAERLLSISGEDRQTVDRKHLSAVTVRLPVRFVITTNELPNLQDSSEALAYRFIVLRLVESWLGREDRSLRRRLGAELPGILLWALEGWRRLRERGHFVQPPSAAELVQELHDLTSPIGAFVRQCCELGSDFVSSVEDLYTGWCCWCEAAGRQPGSKQLFGRNLRAIVPSIRDCRASRGPRSDRTRERCYQGIRRIQTETIADHADHRGPRIPFD